ncbi:MAG TPA: winged helix-turn-helix domain-containing protein [Pyrinomonadaceae bacterium]|jgi:DNA-binding winged helix-turn-helix (wHTH) protein|nr:winged helix-turn-helix domain-containing protein [Pyrinomonadaceae bacterium]
MSHYTDNYEFGPYQFDLNRRVLMRAGEAIPLTPKATEILVMLLANAGQLVEKDELLKEVWPDTFVEESNLTQNIFTLRKALGDDRADPRYIETVTRRGYRFIAPVTVVNAVNFPTTAGVTNSEQLIVAILPFLNNTSNPELEYLAEGLTDNLINSFSRVSKLRVMSHTAISRYKVLSVDPQQAGRELGATSVLIGKLNGRQSITGISVELVDTSAGWQLWGQQFGLENNNLLQIQDAITRQVLTTFKLKLTGDEERHITARYTENAEAYQSYLEGRYHWSRYTRKGIEKAIRHFRKAIEIDPNYALAYAAIVDCYLRLATNYLPPEEDRPRYASEVSDSQRNSDPPQRVKLRFEWDWKGIERELRRADDLKTNYPSAHQWYVAYQISKQLYRESLSKRQTNTALKDLDPKLVSQIPSIHLTPTEEVQILCSVARDQIAVGNYEAARLILRRWTTPGKWPKLDTLNPYAAADLLLTLGTLLGWIAGTGKIDGGHKHAEIFISGSVAIFEQLGVKNRSVEARVELARCFYKQGLFDMARVTLANVAPELAEDELEFKTSSLVLWGSVERDSGRLRDALKILREAASLEAVGNLDGLRCYSELATTLKDLTISEGIAAFAEEAKLYFERALYAYEAIGNHRLAAAIENNFGFLLLSLRLFDESETHLLRSKRLFLNLSDAVRGAQVNETLCRLYIETRQYALARQTIEQAVETLDHTDGEALLAEALRTAGIVAARQKRFADAKKNLEAAFKVAERCGDKEGAGLALLMMFEETSQLLDDSEKNQIAEKLNRLLSGTQQTGLQARVAKCIGKISAADGTI